MLLSWIIAVVVPLLAIFGGPWLVGHLDPGRSTAVGDPMLMPIQFFLAAAPLVGLAIFALVGRARRDAVRVSALVAGLATLVIWGWYHAGAAGVDATASGFALLASPLAIAILALGVYWSMTRAD